MLSQVAGSLVAWHLVLGPWHSSIPTAAVNAAAFYVVFVFVFTSEWSMTPCLILMYDSCDRACSPFHPIRVGDGSYFASCVVNRSCIRTLAT